MNAAPVNDKGGSGGSVYDALTEQHGTDSPADSHWAFGAGFGGTEVEIELTAPAPTGVDAAELAEYCLMLGDDALVYSQRLTEWVTNAPELEEEVALANTALDLLGQARLLLARAGHVEGAGRDEDRLAYWRDQAEFRNVALAEIDDELDFARCIARLLVFATWRLAVLSGLAASTDPVIAAVAAKGVKELTYHRDYAARWTLRLGDGTEESHRRMQAALERVWPYLDELFRDSDPETRLADAGVAVVPSAVRAEVEAVLEQVLTASTLRRPEVAAIGTLAGRGGRQGLHTEKLGPLLTEMQSLARQHPDATW